MKLPSTERREVKLDSFKKLWFYGLPFSGKTYLANQFEKPLLLNTDGNYTYVDAPVMRITDDITTEGRQVLRNYAWEKFKGIIDELEKGSEFKTIIVDLLEDVFDACRIKVCADKGWNHESDDSFKAYDIIRSEFLRVIKRLTNLPYNIVLISHEDTTRDILSKDKAITKIMPNINEKVAFKIAGMVGIACRIVADGSERCIKFKSEAVEFGGGRLLVSETEIPCDYNQLIEVYENAVKNQIQALKNISHKNETVEDKLQNDIKPENEPKEVEVKEELPQRRSRRRIE